MFFSCFNEKMRANVKIRNDEMNKTTSTFTVCLSLHTYTTVSCIRTLEKEGE
jgi:hypothetical protein